jgi:hypothetical protein
MCEIRTRKVVCYPNFKILTNIYDLNDYQTFSKDVLSEFYMYPDVLWITFDSIAINLYHECNELPRIYNSQTDCGNQHNS